MRPRARRTALGPLSVTGGKSPRTALPNPHPPGEALSDDAPTTAKPTLATPLAPAQIARKGRLNFLYSQQLEIAEGLRHAVVATEYAELDSIQGHDAFLVDSERFAPRVARFFAAL